MSTGRRWLFCVTMLRGNEDGVRVHYFTLDEALIFMHQRLHYHNEDHFYTGARVDVVQETEDRCVPTLPYG